MCSHLPLFAWTKGATGQWKRDIPSRVTCCLLGIRCCSAFALLLQWETADPGIRAWSLKGSKQGQAIPKGSVGNGIGTQAWNTAGTEPEALDFPAGALCKSWHPGKVLRVVPTPNQHMKSDR